MNEQEIQTMAERLYECLMMEVWPLDETCVDFGIFRVEHLGALQWAVRVDGVTRERFVETSGYGEKLNALVSLTNPYRGVRFYTVWDEMRLAIDIAMDTEERLNAENLPHPYALSPYIPPEDDSD